MAHTLAIDEQRFSCEATPNRSLTAVGRQLWLSMVAITILFLATAATLIGAWPVLPFAGLEIFLIWFAFGRIAAHDADFETLKIENAMFVLQSQNGKKHFLLSGNAQWAILECKTRANRCALTLRYRGQAVKIGQLLNDVERINLAMRLKKMIRVQHLEELTQ